MMNDPMLQELAGLYAADGGDPTKVYEWLADWLASEYSEGHSDGYEDGFADGRESLV